MTTDPDEPVRGKPLLLLVDDQAANLHLMAEILREEYLIKTLTQGSETLKVAARDPRPDLILLDVMMPDLNGIEVLRRLRANRQTRDIPVIFVSADASEKTQYQGLDDGADDYLVKPVQPLVLRARVRTLLRRKQAEDALWQLNRELELRIEVRTLALSIAKEAAEAASRAMSAFLMTVSHELRTPLTAIMGMTTLASLEASDPDLQHRLTIIEHASEKLLALIDGVLDFSEFEAGRLTLENVGIKLGRVIDEVIAQIGSQASDKGLGLDMRMAHGIAELPLQGDAKRLGQILFNLIDNAVKFTAQGSVAVRLTLADETPADVLVRCDVQDTGIGIASEDLERIFDVFQRADSSMTTPHGGTGLGLAIVKRLARAMGGDLGVDSQPGVGSRFWFTARLARSSGAPGHDQA